MRIAAAILLIFTFVLEMLAGAGGFIFGLMGAATLTRVGDVAGGYAAVVESELDRLIPLLTALESQLDQLVAVHTSLGTSYGGEALAAAGALIVIAGLLTLIAAIRLLRKRPGTIVYVGCAAAIVTNATPLVLLGFGYLPLPGLAGGLLGMLAVHRMHGRVVSKPAVKPGGAATPSAATEPPPAAKPPTAIKIRPTVKMASDPSPADKPAPRIPLRRAALISAGAVLISGALVVAFLAYQKYFPRDGADAPARTAASAPAPSGKKSLRTAPPPAPEPEPASPALAASGPVKGQLAGTPFKPGRAALKVDTSWTIGNDQTRDAVRAIKAKRLESLSLVLEAGRDLQIQIEGLPESYDFATGLKLRVIPGPAKPGQPRLILTSPQSGNPFPKIDTILDDYDLDLRLQPLKGNRVNGRIALLLPEDKKTNFSGKFEAWVDGHPEIEPDLTRGGQQTFRYLTYQYLKEIHPGSAITIKDDTYAHQVGDASRMLTGHIMVVYSVDGEEHASILRVTTSEGYWRVLDSMDATYLAEAHPATIPDPKNEGQWLNYLAARQTEEWFREEHPGKYPWSVRLTGTSNSEIGYAEIHLRLEPYGEPEALERRYYFLRRDGRWRYIRDLKKGEEIDQKTGKVLVKRGHS